VTNVSGVTEPQPAFKLCTWLTERWDVAEYEVAFCDVTAVLGSRAATVAAVVIVAVAVVVGETLEVESLQRGIFVAELLEDELGAILRTGFAAEVFDVWPQTSVLVVSLSVHRTIWTALSQKCETSLNYCT